MYKPQICENPTCSKRVSLLRRYCSKRCIDAAWMRANGWHATRYALRHGATELERIIPQEVFDRDEWVCQICQGPVDPTLAYPHRLSVTLDHVIPISLGGSHTLDNVQCAHFACNSRKGSRTGVPAGKPLGVTEVTLRESIPLLPGQRMTLDALRKASTRPGFPHILRQSAHSAGIYDLAALRMWREARSANYQPL